MSFPARGWIVLGPFLAPKPIAFLISKQARTLYCILIGSGVSRKDIPKLEKPIRNSVRLVIFIGQGFATNGT